MRRRLELVAKWVGLVIGGVRVALEVVRCIKRGD